MCILCIPREPFCCHALHRPQSPPSRYTRYTQTPQNPRPTGLLGVSISNTPYLHGIHTGGPLRVCVCGKRLRTRACSCARVREAPRLADPLVSPGCGMMCPCPTYPPPMWLGAQTRPSTTMEQTDSVSASIARTRRLGVPNVCVFSYATVTSAARAVHGATRLTTCAITHTRTSRTRSCKRYAAGATAQRRCGN